MWHRKVTLVWVFLFVLLGSGCSTAPQVQKLDPAIYYRHDLKLKIGLQLKSGDVYNRVYNFTGVGTLPAFQEYEIQVTAPGKIDLFRVWSCHKEVPVQASNKNGWLQSNKVYKFVYTPNEIEKNKSCLLRIEAFNIKGRHASGVLDFESILHKLSFLIDCNGESVNANGVFVCQSREKLIQRIKFFEEVKWHSVNSKCKLKTSDNIEFEFHLANRECYFSFLSASGKTARLTTIGYENILIRE